MGVRDCRPKEKERWPELQQYFHHRPRLEILSSSSLTLYFRPQYTWHAPTIISFSPSSISLIRLDLSLLNLLNCSSSFLLHIFGRWQLGAKGNVSGRDNSDWNSNRHGDQYSTASLQNSMDNGQNTLTFKQTDQFAIYEVTIILSIWTSWHISYIWGTAPCDESLIKGIVHNFFIFGQISYFE